MSMFNTLLWGAVGYTLGGPIGAVLAAVASKALSGDPNRDGRGQLPGKQQENEVVFFATAFSLLGKLAKADGVVSQSEVAVVDRFIRDGLRLNDAQRTMAIDIFNAAKDSDHSFGDIAAQYYQQLRHSPAMMREMLRVLYTVAAADGVFHPKEKQLMNEAARVFRIPETEHDLIRKSFFPSTEGHYATLGCQPTDSMDTVKKRYRALVTENHPDKILALGLPEEFVKLATEKLQKINEAYAAIQKSSP